MDSRASIRSSATPNDEPKVRHSQRGVIFSMCASSHEIGRRHTNFASRKAMIPAPEPIARGRATSPDGVEIAWSRYGSGDRAVLFVPTWNLVDSRVVGHQVVALEPHATVVTFDPRGAGVSDRPDARLHLRGARRRCRRRDGRHRHRTRLDRHGVARPQRRHPAGDRAPRARRAHRGDRALHAARARGGARPGGPRGRCGPIGAASSIRSCTRCSASRTRTRSSPR